MDIQAIKLVKALIRGEKLPKDESPSIKIHHRVLDPAVLVAAPGQVVFPSGKIKKMRMWAMENAGVPVADVYIQCPGIFIPAGIITVAVAGINYTRIRLGWGANHIEGIEINYHHLTALESPALLYYFGAGSASALVEVHYE